MRRRILCLCCVVLFGLGLPVEALNPGADILVPAAARAGSWVTDLYVMNPGDESVNGSIFWLVRGQANADPISIDFALDPGEARRLGPGLRYESGRRRLQGDRR